MRCHVITHPNRGIVDLTLNNAGTYNPILTSISISWIFSFLSIQPLHQRFLECIMTYFNAPLGARLSGFPFNDMYPREYFVDQLYTITKELNMYHRTDINGYMYIPINGEKK